MNPVAMLEPEVMAEDEIDLIQEMRLRTWARRNYVAAANRDANWHPIILDEMRRVDQEN